MVKWILGIIGLIFSGIILLVAGFYMIARQTASDLPEELTLQGLKESLTIRLDSEGVPHIQAVSTHDAMMALGYLHANDRMFQMELVRRLVSGRLSEWFGEAALETDKRQRTLGFYRIAALDAGNLDSLSRLYLDAYTSGINQWISGRQFHTPEFMLLMTRPEPWKPEDCLSIMVYQTWFSHNLMDDDPSYRKLVEVFGPDIISALTKPLGWDKPTLPDAVSPDFLQSSEWPFRMAESSNSWAVSPAKSASGSALHASDPHLPVNSAPGFWYVVDIETADGLVVTGITAPGIPMVPMGKTPDIAYSFTVSSIDMLDYYRFIPSLSDSLLVTGPEGASQLTTINESITVSGFDKPVSHTVLLSDLGPVIEKDSIGYIVVRWAGFDFSSSVMIRNGFDLPRSTTFQDFRQRVTGLGALDANWMYSDKKGNIGYQLGTPVPLREDSVFAFVLLDGAKSEHRWKGYLSLDQTPHRLNPVNGWLATCNNRIADHGFPAALPGYYDPYRYLKISTYLSEKEIFSLSDFKNFQLDSLSGKALVWKNLLAAGLDSANEPKWAARIRTWNGGMGVSSSEATLFNLWWEQMKRELLADNLGGDWKKGKEALNQLLTWPSEELTDLADTPQKETIVDISRSAVEKVLDRGPILPWGVKAKLEIRHPLSVIPGFDFFFSSNRGPFPMKGDGGSLNANFHHFDEESGLFYTDAAPSMRFLVDWSRPDSISIMGNLGQSGNPFSPFYDNWLDNWMSGTGHAIIRKKESGSIYRFNPAH